jgi:hypothetical protein
MITIFLTSPDCDDTDTVYQVENERFIGLSYGVAKLGWMNTFINGKQFLPPLADERDECLHQQYHSYFLKGTWIQF